MRKRALIIGVDRYRSPLPTLKVAQQDATEIHSLLKLLDFEPVRILNEPNQQMVKEAIGHILEGVGHGDQFFFFFSGHGVQETDGNQLLLLSEASMNPRMLEEREEVISLNWLKSRVEGKGLDSLFFLDCCRTHTEGGRGTAELSAYNRVGVRDIVRKAQSPNVDTTTVDNISVLFACDQGEKAHEVSGEQGLFSKAFIEICKEQFNQGQTISIGTEFLTDLKNSLKSHLSRYGITQDQTPSIASSVPDLAFEIWYPKETPNERKHREDKAAWEEARSQDSFEAYENYLVNQPEGFYLDQAKEALNRFQKQEEFAYWDKVKASDTEADYRDYILRYPNGFHTDIAQSRLKELIKGTLPTEANSGEIIEEVKHNKGQHYWVVMSVFLAMLAVGGYLYNGWVAEQQKIAEENQKNARIAVISDSIQRLLETPEVEIQQATLSEMRILADQLKDLDRGHKRLKLASRWMDKHKVLLEERSTQKAITDSLSERVMTLLMSNIDVAISPEEYEARIDYVRAELANLETQAANAPLLYQGEIWLDKHSKRLERLKTKLKQLTVTFDDHLANDRLTYPPGNNTLFTVERVEELTGEVATALRKKIADRYYELAYTDLEKLDIDAAEKLIKKGLSVAKNAQNLSGLNKQLVSLALAIEEMAGLRINAKGKQQAAAKRTNKPIFHNAPSESSIGHKMILIPGGSFLMGSALAEEGREKDEGPMRPVKITDFYLSETEVTVAQFRRFVDATNYVTKAEKDKEKGCNAVKSFGKKTWDWTSGMNWRNASMYGRKQKSSHPVVCVTWHDAKAYINWLNKETNQTFRLPSESEWEYAARAGSTTKYHFGNSESQLCKYGNVADTTELPNGVWRNKANCSDKYAFTAPVGSYRANKFGLKDMVGNVWEWTEDCWNSSYSGAPNDGSAWTSGDCGYRVVRGGSWNNNPARVRSAYRDGNGAAYRDTKGGFRLAQDL